MDKQNAFFESWIHSGPKMDPTARLAVTPTTSKPTSKQPRRAFVRSGGGGVSELVEHP
jgi:hypothetical protein